MDNRINVFLDELRAGLAGLPGSESREAVEYYEEYINDALDEGESVENILSRLDSPEKTAAVIMAETSIRKAKNSPGLKNYSRALKYSRTLITRPLSVLLFSIFIFVTYCTAFLLFVGAIGSAAAACALITGSVFEAIRIPSKYSAEIAGIAGMGLSSAALCLLLAYGLFKLCRLFIRLSAGLVSRMLGRSGEKLNGAGIGSSDNEYDHKKQAVKGVRLSKWVPAACLVAIIAGLVLSFSTGLPVKLFTIFNSMKPADISIHQWEYNKADVTKISIKTAHSHIRLEKGSTDKIMISYEQPDWMEPEITLANGQLLFTEKSNGRMPLFSLVTIHENRTDVVLTLPEGFDPEALALESRGGFIYISTGDFNTTAKTFTGSIYIGSDAAKTAGITASTSTGVIRSGSADAGIRNGSELRYEAAARGGKSIDAETSRGSIYIE